MIELNSTQFWIAVLFVFQFLFVVFLFFTIKKIDQIKTDVASNRDHCDDHPVDASEYSTQVIEMLEPLLREARKTAKRFDDQIKEKKRLLKELNEALDNRIININLLLSRAENQHNKMLEKQTAMANVVMPENVVLNQNMTDMTADIAIDQQHKIIQMYDQKMDMDTIAQQLSVPRGEVQMVIELKKKFLEMERTHP
jgi:hypothetical protein